MPNELEVIGVSRPGSFDPAKDYAEVIARSGSNDEWIADFDLNEISQIFRYDLAVLSQLLFVEGAVLFEAGGTIGQPIAGVALGGDILGSGGIYRGIRDTQIYTVRIVTPGAVGTATYTWSSTGSDNPYVGGTTVPITAIAPSLAAALGEPQQYAHPVGTLGVVVYFVNPTGAVNASSWLVQATYGAQPPVVTKASPDAGHDRLHCSDVVTVVAGAPRRVRAATLTVPAATTGVTIIYGEWTRRIVTHAEDPLLVDPLSDTPTAYRMQWPMVYRTENTSGLALGPNEVERRVFPLYVWDRATNVVTRVVRRPYAIDLELTQGAVDAERMINVKGNILLQGVLAELDRGAHGAYVVKPRAPSARATLSTNAAPSGTRRIALAPSVVRVEGILVKHDDPVELDVDQATEFTTVAGEQHTYSAALGGFFLNKAVGERVFPIRAIAQLRAHVQVGTGSGGSGSGYEVLTRGSDDTLNQLNPVDPGSWIVSANAGGGGTVYAQGTGSGQWQLVGQAITWPGGGGPTGGASYHVRYKYNRVMVENVDFTLDASGFINFAPAGVDPFDTGIVTVDYTAYLPRVDRIIVRPSGDYVWVKGLAAEEPLVPVLPALTCPYVRVELGAGPAGIVRLVSEDNDAVYMEQLNRTIRAVRELTANDATQDMHNQLRDGTTGNPIDIQAEAFATLDVADQFYTAGGVTFDALIDTLAGELTLPFTAATYLPTRQTAGLPGGETAVRVGGDFFTLPYTDELAITQDAYSREYPVNPYADFTPEDPELRLTPDQDLFLEIVSQTVNDVAQIRKLQALRRGLISGPEAARLLRDFRAANGRPAGRLEVIGNLDPEVVGSYVSTLPALYMRQITLTVSGVHLLAGEKVRAKFDGKDVVLTAVAPTTTGGTQGTGGDAAAVVCTPVTLVSGDITDSGGAFVATFPVPPNVPIGTRQLVLYGNLANAGATWNSADPTAGGYVVRGALPFTSEGEVRTTVTQTRTLQVIKEPIAQSVVFPEARMLSRIEVPLATKGAPGDQPLIFQIRGTDRSGKASTPTDEVLTSITREPAALNAGPASVNTFVPTDPVLAFPNEYRALSFRSASNAYQAYVAALGEPNRATGGVIQSQAIPGGIFMDSANNTDWTLRQGWDLRCKVYVAKYTVSTALLYLSRISHTDITGFTLHVDEARPDGTAIDWEYSVDGAALTAGGKVWRPFVPFVPVEVPPLPDGSVGDTLDLRATLRTSSLYVSPGVHQRNCSVLVTSNKLTAVYVSKPKALSANAIGGGNECTITAHVEVLHAPGGSHALYVSVNNGANWHAVTLAAAGVLEDGFTRYTGAFDFGALPAESAVRRLRTRLELTTPNKALRPRAHRLGAYAEPV